MFDQDYLPTLGQPKKWPIELENSRGTNSHDNCRRRRRLRELLLRALMPLELGVATKGSEEKRKINKLPPSDI